MLSLQITGLPAGTAAAVNVSDGGGTAVGGATATQTLMLPAGPYSVTADRVTVADPVVRPAYYATIAGAAPCVRAGMTATATVSYQKIASSNKVWSGNSTGGTAPMLGFAAADLLLSGAPPAAVAATTAGSGGFTFDAAGNLWVIDETQGDAPIKRYPASALGTSGAKVADLTLTHPTLTRGAPGPVALAFDSSGGLWVSIAFSAQVAYFSPQQVAAGGAQPPAGVLRTLAAPSGLAFDSAQNLWVALSDSTVVRFNAARLLTVDQGADLVITANTPPPVIGALSSPTGLAFDSSGNLWVNYEGAVARLEAADLAGAGDVTITPAVQVALDVAALPAGLAFDEGGGLWLAYSQGKLARLSSTQLDASGTKTPETVIDSVDLGYAGWVALYPAPALLPLYHHLN